MHVIVLLTLALIVTAGPIGFNRRTITLGISESEAFDIDVMLQLPSTAVATSDGAIEADARGSLLSASSPLVSEMIAEMPDVSHLDEPESLLGSRQRAAAFQPLPSIEELRAELPFSARRKPATDSLEGVSAAKSPADAVGSVLSHLRKDLAEGQTYTIWLLDSSLSLVKERQQLAQYLRPFFEDYKVAPGEKPRLMSAVVAFGAAPVPVQDTTAFSERTLRAIRDLPLDESGIENVMTAVQQTVKRYAFRAKGGLRIVIWTDESGDDLALLEPTIELCKKHNCVVHVVGPTSVLGTDAGLQPYTDAATGFRFLLPVKRGPDSCLLERVRLPYWFDTASNGGTYDGVIVADGMPWYGGVYRERLLSGTGPWCLTRLALQTGGSYTLLDREGERRTFGFDVMRDYMPDYGSLSDVLETIDNSPLRQAVHAATQATYMTWLDPPEMSFIDQRSTVYPYQMITGIYYPPARFQSLLAQRIAREVTEVTAAAGRIEQALQHFTGNVDWEVEYVREESRRWRAWYDLTRGRLLMTSIRQQEYLAACRWLTTPGNLAASTNRVVFTPAPGLTAGNELLGQRRELAVQLLERCRTEHAGTPWALLAEWELETDVGIQPIQSTLVPLPPPLPGRSMNVDPPAQPIVIPRL